MLALAGTLGVGNIVGVAYGIKVGGAGVVFWIFASALFSSPLKYAESYLTALYGDSLGIVYSIRESLSRFVGRSYAILCLLLSLFLGGGLQSKSVISAASIAGFNSCAVSVIFALLVLFAIIGGAGKIEGLNARVIPIATVFYIGITLSVIIVNIASLPKALFEILRGALDFRAVTGGVLSFLGLKAMREGFARGLLSNEAGAGSSALAEGRSKLSPSEVGLFGVCEVVFDTVILSTLTGLAIVASGGSLDGDGIEIVTRAVASAFGAASPTVMFSLIAVFSYSAVICRYYYGEECFNYLFKNLREERKKRVLIPLYISFVLLSGFLSERLLVFVSDILLFLMTVITAAALIKNSERIKAPSENVIKEV